MNFVRTLCLTRFPVPSFFGGKTTVESQGAGMAFAFWDGCNGLGFILIFLVDLLGITASNMEPIYWNTLNKR